MTTQKNRDATVFLVSQNAVISSSKPPRRPSPSPAAVANSRIISSSNSNNQQQHNCRINNISRGIFILLFAHRQDSREEEEELVKSSQNREDVRVRGLNRGRNAGELFIHNKILCYRANSRYWFAPMILLLLFACACVRAWCASPPPGVYFTYLPLRACI